MYFWYARTWIAPSVHFNLHNLCRTSSNSIIIDTKYVNQTKQICVNTLNNLKTEDVVYISTRRKRIIPILQSKDKQTVKDSQHRQSLQQQIVVTNHRQKTLHFAIVEEVFFCYVFFLYKVNRNEYKHDSKMRNVDVFKKIFFIILGLALNFY